MYLLDRKPDEWEMQITVKLESFTRPVSQDAGRKKSDRDHPSRPLFEEKLRSLRIGCNLQVSPGGAGAARFRLEKWYSKQVLNGRAIKIAVPLEVGLFHWILVG